jgi:hypothetical protein
MDFDDETAVADDLFADETDDALDNEFFPDDEAESSPDNRPARQPSVSLEQVIAYFAPCGRCGYFLTGYRAALGLENLQTAVNRAKSGWIVLTWNDVVRDLVLKSYASDIEENDFHYDGCCPECRRHFIYRASRSANHPHTLRIELKPRKRQ